MSDARAPPPDPRPDQPRKPGARNAFRPPRATAPPCTRTTGDTLTAVRQRAGGPQRAVEADRGPALGPLRGRQLGASLLLFFADGTLSDTGAAGAPHRFQLIVEPARRRAVPAGRGPVLLRLLRRLLQSLPPKGVRRRANQRAGARRREEPLRSKPARKLGPARRRAEPRRRACSASRRPTQRMRRRHGLDAGDSAGEHPRRRHRARGLAGRITPQLAGLRRHTRSSTARSCTRRRSAPAPMPASRPQGKRAPNAPRHMRDDLDHAAAGRALGESAAACCTRPERTCSTTARPASCRSTASRRLDATVAYAAAELRGAAQPAEPDRQAYYFDRYSSSRTARLRCAADLRHCVTLA